MADVDIRRGRWTHAAARLDRALAGHHKIGRPDGLAETWRSVGDLAAANYRRERRSLLVTLNLDEAVLQLPPFLAG